MAKEVGLRETKLIQYLNEAYGKERALEAALTEHIKETSVGPYKKKLQGHLKETKAHGRDIKKRIKALGGDADEPPLAKAATKASATVSKAVARAGAVVQTALGASDAEKLLKQVKSQYSENSQKIAQYTAIQSLADALSDAETSKLAKSILREEQRMGKYLEGLIPRLTKSVVSSEIPARDRKPKPAAAAAKPAARATARKPAAKKPAAKRAAAKPAAKTAAAKKPAARTAAAKPAAASKPAAAKKPTARRTAAKKTSTNGSSGSTRARTTSKS